MDLSEMMHYTKLVSQSHTTVSARKVIYFCGFPVSAAAEFRFFYPERALPDTV